MHNNNQGLIDTKGVYTTTMLASIYTAWRPHVGRMHVDGIHNSYLPVYNWDAWSNAPQLLADNYFVGS